MLSRRRIVPISLHHQCHCHRHPWTFHSINVGIVDVVVAGTMVVVMFGGASMFGLRDHSRVRIDPMVAIVVWLLLLLLLVDRNHVTTKTKDRSVS